MRALILAALACLIATPAGAQIDDLNRAIIENHFTRDTPITVLFESHLEDGCLVRPQAIQAAMELSVQRAGLKLAAEPTSGWALWATAHGQETKFADGRGTDSCIYVIFANFVRASTFRDVKHGGDPMPLLVEALSAPTYGLDQKANVQDRIRRWMIEIVDTFANEILKATAK